MKWTKRIKNKKVIIVSLISLILAAITVAVAVVGVNYWQNQKFGETFYSVSCLKVNNKVRILQISDLHECTYGDQNATLVDRVSKLKPDLIVLTGDCVAEDGSADQIAKLCGALAKIAPSYYIYGNNEVEAVYRYPLTQEALDAQFGFDDENREPQKLLAQTDVLADKLTAAGVTVLKNSGATTMVGDTLVDIYGVLTSNPSAFWSYAGESFEEFLYTDDTPSEDHRHPRAADL